MTRPIRPTRPPMHGARALLPARAVLPALALLAALPAAAQEPVRGGELDTFTSGYRTLNPAVQSGAATGVPGSQIFAGLVLIGADYQATPYLAESWEISEDALAYTFHLVPGATFHDGAPITAEDVAFSLETVRANHPFGQAMFGQVETVEAPDPQTVVVRLSQPVPGLLLSMQPLLLPIIPKHVYGDGQELRSHPRNMEDVVGSGPFKVESNDLERGLVLVRNDAFFIEGKPYLERIVMPRIPDALARALMLENGEIDLAGFAGLTPQSADRLEKVDGLTVTTEGYGAVGYIHYLEMNLREKPFSDRAVREALAHAIDTGFLSKVIFRGRATPGDGPLHGGNPFHAEGLPAYAPDLELAATMLDAAGYPAGADGKRFAFELDVPSWAPQAHRPMAEYIKSQLGKLGIEVTLRPAPDFASWAKKIGSFGYQATMNGSFNYPDPVIGMHRHFDCDNIRNVIWANTQGYCDPAMDALLDAAAVEMDVQARKAIYADIQRKAVEDVVFIWMPEDYTTSVWNARVQNPPEGAFGPLAPWMDVWLKD
ncbi:ABC transporter substrate-binding protein [Albimonas sp. CAU 1670]|uniref:ABC transporter substrate-binding protein n=1 Tax=Albimonas sp. CAU 1670 TaxID=3032599 RepID=UPI0023D9E732|nr:ABC transporter substrate-binding protein [Albimonas sp. CAU 1670]MDF2235165.1 ABC transporter substrate-binding protein [Albimonas sp. CAU 1670]